MGQQKAALGAAARTDPKYKASFSAKLGASPEFVREVRASTKEGIARVCPHLTSANSRRGCRLRGSPQRCPGRGAALCSPHPFLGRALGCRGRLLGLLHAASESSPPLCVRDSQRGVLRGKESCVRRRPAVASVTGWTLATSLPC